MTTEMPVSALALQHRKSAEDYRHNREVVLQAVAASPGPWSTSEFAQEIMSTSGLSERQVYQGIVSLTSDGILQFRGSLGCLVKP
jgi:hypothetical protein